MKCLWDTCVLPELGKSDRDPFVVRYLESIPTGGTFISAITVGEIRYGLNRLPLGQRRKAIEDVMHQVLVEFTPPIPPVDAVVASVWGELVARTIAHGFNISVPDTLIAATAAHYGMHAVTRNVKDFAPTGVLVVNRWDPVGT